MVRITSYGIGPYLPEERPSVPPKFGPPEIDSLPKESGVDRPVTKAALAHYMEQLKLDPQTPQIEELLHKINPSLPLAQQLLKLRLTDGKFGSDSDKVGGLLSNLLSEVIKQTPNTENNS